MKNGYIWIIIIGIVICFLYLHNSKMVFSSYEFDYEEDGASDDSFAEDEEVFEMDESNGDKLMPSGQTSHNRGCTFISNIDPGADGWDIEDYKGNSMSMDIKKVKWINIQTHRGRMTFVPSAELEGCFSFRTCPPIEVTSTPLFRYQQFYSDNCIKDDRGIPIQMNEVNLGKVPGDFDILYFPPGKHRTLPKSARSGAPFIVICDSYGPKQKGYLYVASWGYGNIPPTDLVCKSSNNLDIGELTPPLGECEGGLPLGNDCIPQTYIIMGIIALVAIILLL